ncbi:hypothetical protein AAMO2058_000842100 [Amorphochlora amoebiformis]
MSLDSLRDGHHPSPRINSQKSTWASGAIRIPASNRQKAKIRGTNKWIFFLLPKSGQRYIQWSAGSCIVTVALCVFSIVLLNGPDEVHPHVRLVRTAWAIVVANIYSFGLVCDGVYSEAASRIWVSALLTVLFLTLSVGGFMEITFMWHQENGPQQPEHWVYWAAMLVGAFTAIVNLSFAAHSIFLPGLGAGYFGPRGGSLLPQDSSTTIKLAMREVYEQFVSSLNLDLGLSLIIATLCYESHWPDVGEGSPVKWISTICNMLLLFGSPFWAMFVWLAVANELQCSLIAIFMGGFLLPFIFVIQQISNTSEPMDDKWSAIVHKWVVIICGVSTLLGRLNLLMSTLKVFKFVGRGLKSQVYGRKCMEICKYMSVYGVV